MNGNALIRILATFGLLIASLWVSFDIFTSGSNAVARFYMYAMVVSGIYGLLNARKAFYLLLFLTGYLDYFKRFMIFDSAVSKTDLYFVLGIAPATLAGICGNILYQHFTGKLAGRPGLNKLIVITVVACGAATILALTSAGGSFRSLGDSVNATAYIMLLFVVPALFRTPEELRTMIKVLVILYVPAICYMLVHHFRGSIFDWEMDYVKSGLTIEIRQLQERVFRPFGTLNSAANASMIFAAIWTFCWSPIWGSRGRDGKTSPLGIRFLLIPMLGIAMYATYSRTGWVFAVVAVLGLVLMKHRSLTLASYVSAFVLVVTIVLASPYLLKHRILNEISDDIIQKKGDRWAQTTNISTLNDRLEGFEGLVKEPRAWTPFGLRLSPHSIASVRANTPSHDMFTDLLLNYGFVTLLVGGGFLMRQLWKLHTFVFYEPEPLAKNIAVTCLSLGLSISSGALSNGAQFSTYPVNFFIWFCFSIGVSLAIYGVERDGHAAGKDPAPDGSLLSPSQMRVAPSRPIATPVPAHAKG